MNKNTRYVLLILVLLGTLFVVSAGYKASHRKYAGQTVYTLCDGTYLPVDILKNSEVTSPHSTPCTAITKPFMLRNDNRLIYASLVVLGLALGAGTTMLQYDRRAMLNKKAGKKKK